VRTLGGLEILVNHAGTQEPADDLTKISTEQWRRTFDVNVTGVFWLTKYALPHLGRGAAIINTASINGLRGNKTLIDYSASKGAVLAFTYAMAQNLVDRGIRVNAVAPGPVWTPLIPATFDEEKVEKFGEHVPLGRPAQPDEIAPSYVFFAANSLSSYYTGEVLSPAGGEIHPG
jgi:NAD(P)-dependent dehydrogenase (short-subunit alcohol dehydrogenase family)